VLLVSAGDDMDDMEMVVDILEFFMLEIHL